MRDLTRQDYWDLGMWGLFFLGWILAAFAINRVNTLGEQRDRLCVVLTTGTTWPQDSIILGDERLGCR